MVLDFSVKVVIIFVICILFLSLVIYYEVQVRKLRRKLHDSRGRAEELFKRLVGDVLDEEDLLDRLAYDDVVNEILGKDAEGPKYLTDEKKEVYFKRVEVWLKRFNELGYGVRSTVEDNKG